MELILAAVTACFPYAQLATALDDAYGERPVGTFLSAEGHVMQVTANMETGSWTQLIVNPDGTACMRDSGSGAVVGAEKPGEKM